MSDPRHAEQHIRAMLRIDVAALLGKGDLSPLGQRLAVETTVSHLAIAAHQVWL